MRALFAALFCLSLSGCFYPAENFEARADMAGSFDLSIPLDVAVVASNPQRFAVRGKYIQIDPGSTGQANLRINSVSDTPRLAYPGQQFSPGDFTDLYFDYIAQPGKFLHVVYGESPDILSGGQRVALDAPINQTFYQNQNIATAINVILTAPQNTRGIKILGGDISVSTGAASTASGWIFIGAFRYCAIGVGADTANGRPIPQLYVPPGLAFGWTSQITGATGVVTISLNYELLP